jgi:hypothetical protein
MNQVNKKFIIVMFAVLLLLHFSCKEKKKEKENILPAKTETEFTTGSIFSHSGQTQYEAYIPTAYKKGEKLPAILFFDPHGDGKLPLMKYKSLADKFKFILVGSDISKNGLPLEDAVIVAGQLADEATGYLPGDPGFISFCGFSGGAKTALAAANQSAHVNTVIYAGATLPAEMMTSLPSSFGIAGKADMNYSDMISFSKEFELQKKPHVLYLWKGEHVWPDSVAMLHAFYYSYIIYCSGTNNKADEKLFSEYKNLIYDQVKKEKDILIKAALAGEWNKCLQSLRLAEDTLYKQITASFTYSSALKKEEQILSKENDEKTKIVTAFTNGDETLLANKSNSLRRSSDLMSKRLNSYISLAAYTFSRRSLSSNNYEAARKYLSIYKSVDPENTEQPFLKACMYAKINEPDSAMLALTNAVKMGLHDGGKIITEADLQVLKEREDFKALVSSLQQK